MTRTKAPLIAADKQHHVRVSQRGFERLEACFKVSGVKSRRLMLDNLIRGWAVDMGVEASLEKRWRRTGQRKKAKKARGTGNGANE